MKLSVFKNIIVFVGVWGFSSLHCNEVYPGVSAAATFRGLWLPPCNHAVGYTYESPYHEKATLDVGVLSDEIMSLDERELEGMINALSLIALENKSALSSDEMIREISDLVASMKELTDSLGADFLLMEEIGYLDELTDQEEEILAHAFASFKTFDVIINENADDIFLTDLEDEMISKAFRLDDRHIAMNETKTKTEPKTYLTPKMIKEITEELIFRDIPKEYVNPQEFDVKEEPNSNLK